MPNNERPANRTGRNPADADRSDPLWILDRQSQAAGDKDLNDEDAQVVLRALVDLWQALNDAIDEQGEDARNDISDAYRLHPLYAKHFPEDHAAAPAEAEGMPPQ
jgi:hypothetical protein